MIFLHYLYLIAVLIAACAGHHGYAAEPEPTEAEKKEAVFILKIQNVLSSIESNLAYFKNVIRDIETIEIHLDGAAQSASGAVKAKVEALQYTYSGTRSTLVTAVKNSKDLLDQVMRDAAPAVEQKGKSSITALEKKTQAALDGLDRQLQTLKNQIKTLMDTQLAAITQFATTAITQSGQQMEQETVRALAELNNIAQSVRTSTAASMQSYSEAQINALKNRFDTTANEIARISRENKRKLAEQRAKDKMEELKIKRNIAEEKADADQETAKKVAEIAAQSEQEKEKLRLKHEVEHADLISKKKIEQIQERTKATFEQAAKMIQDGKTLAAIATATGLTIASILVVKNLLPVVKKAIEEHLFTPDLVSDTSFQGITGLFKKKQTPQQTLANLYFNPKLKKQVDTIVATLRGTKKNNGFYQNYLLYGPPGTGKTALARALAYESGMDYAIFSGGDVQKLLSSGKAAEKIADIFKWANKSNKGLILFIDEADAFLKDPNKYKMSDELYSVLNSFLNLTGTESKKICLIMSTNHPQNLPPAVLSRVGPGQYIYMGLPEYPERLRIIKHFLNLYLGRYFVEKVKAGDPELAGDNPQVKVGDTKLDDAGNPVYDETLKGEIADYIAKKTDKFSGRNLSYLILAIEKAMLAEKMTTLDNALIDRVVTEAVEQRSASESFKSEA